MIAQLTGTIAQLGAASAVVLVGGVGFSVQLTPTHALELRSGQEVTIVTAMVVREDAITLFGFRSAAEREVFELLTSVSGVGPKSALSVLSQLAPDELARAVEIEDLTAFKRVSGVGPKIARMITVQLKGKLTVASANQQDAPAPVGGAVRDDVVEALIGLGTTQKQAVAAVETACEDPVAQQDVPTLLRAALKILGATR